MFVCVVHAVGGDGVLVLCSLWLFVLDVLLVFGAAVVCVLALMLVEVEVLMLLFVFVVCVC